jgi:NADH-quinone oxidoreductase subunit E
MKGGQQGEGTSGKGSTMSTTSTPGTRLPKEAMLNETTMDRRAEIPVEIAGPVNLMAHPLAGVAAMSAVGLGFASQAIGAWLGVLSGAAVASYRLFSPMFDEYEADAFRESRVPAARAQSSIAKLARDVDATVIPLRPRASAIESVISKNAAEVTLPPTAKVNSKVALVSKRVVSLEEPSPVKAVPKRQTAASHKAAEARRSAGAAATKPAAKLKPAAIDRPEHPDDLKTIPGLGPKVEQVLNGLGVWTYAQISAWNDAEIAWVDDTLGFNGRIRRDDWLGQAKSLAASRG